MVAGGAAGAPVETWTVLFTDQVGSTAMRVRVGEGPFDGIRADLDARVAAALEAHGVVVSKSTGDGVMGGFTSTAAALRCAVAIQQAVAERNRTASEGVAAPEALALRIGISVGDAVVENGDLQGTAVVEAARLCGAATDGAILCSEAVRVVSANRSGCTFGPTRRVHLKGLPGPVQAHEVAWEPLPYDPREHRLAFRVLGPLEVLDRDRQVGVRGAKERSILAVLLARVNSAVSVDALVDAVWGDRPPRTADRTVHAYVARLRRTLEPRRPRGEPSTMLATVGRGYELRLDAAQLDSTRFEELAKRGSDQLERGDDAASSTLRQALGLWRGEAFGEFPEVEGCVAAARRLEELRLALVEDLVDADLADGRSSDLVGEIETLLRDEPFRERLWAQLIVALYRSGRQHDALEAYQRARRLLTEELGIEPGPDLRRLEAAVLAQDPSLEVIRPVPAAARGLPAALAAVGPAFLGRETELGWLREAWADAVDGRGGFVSVLGPEGIGKTRLVAELALGVHDDGAAVLYGRCDHAHRGAGALLGQAVQSAGSSLIDIYRGAADDGDIAEAVARYLPTWSQGRPVLVVLDDLHLADAETLEVVADLAGWCRATPMLVVGAFRNDTVPPTGYAEAAGGAASQLALGPLSNDAVGRICELYATQPWSTEDVSRVFELTGGVPLLVHEQASEWARERESRRMTEASDRMTLTHRTLLASRGEIADGVEGIQRLLEQRRAQLAGREAQRQASAVAALGSCPYKGLARFEAADAANFFGRERLVAELVARLAESSLLAVVGPSGSGKSSLVRAGLLPALAAGVLPAGAPWRSAIVSPGPHPARELSHRLHDDDQTASGPRVVFVDQFEETFTAGAERAEQEGFIGRLLDLVDRPDTAVVLAIRADHLGRCATFPELADRLTGNDVLVGPMRDSELRRAVELPAQRAGLETEPGLAEVIMTDVAGRAGALPLLSTALAETWERRDARALTLAGYRAAGGVNGALARMAEDAYAALAAGPRIAARRLLLRLCDAGEDGDLNLRRRLPVVEAADEQDTDARAALETFADHRLLTIDRDAVEIAHEALLREWPRLHTWLGEDVQGRWLHRRLHDATRSWEAASHDPSELYRGTRLGAASDWATSHDDELSQSERAFLAASRAQSQQELAAAQRQAADRARSNRRLRGQLVALAIALVVAVVVGSVAVSQRKRASDEADAARTEAVRADARRVGAQALLAEPIDESLMLAVEGVRLDNSPDTRANLLGALTRIPSQLIRSAHTASPLGDLDVSPQGEVVAVASADRILFFDADTLEPLGTALEARGTALGDFTHPVFRPGGTRLAVATPSALIPVALVDATTFEDEALELGGIPDAARATALDYSADGRFLAVSFWFNATGFPGEPSVPETGEVLVWDVTALDRPILRITTGGPTDVTFHPNGGLLYLGTLTPASVTAHEIPSGERVFSSSTPGFGLDVSPDGRQLAAAAENEIVLLDAASGAVHARLDGHRDAVTAVQFSNDGTLLASASRDGTVVVWDVASGERREQFGFPAQVVSGLRFSPDDSTLYTAAEEGWLLALDLRGDRRFVRRLPVDVPPWQRQHLEAVPAPGGDAVAYIAQDNDKGVPQLSIHFRDTRTAKIVESDDAGEFLGTWSWRPDGRRFAAVSDDGFVRVWDRRTGELIIERRVTSAAVSALAYSADGKRLIASLTGRIIALDAETLERIGEPLDTDYDISTLSASSDSRTIVILDNPSNFALDPSDLAFVDLVDRRIVQTGDIDFEPAAVEFSSDGQRVAVAGIEGEVRVLDAGTGESVWASTTGHDSGKLQVGFSPGGEIVAASGDDGRVSLWDGESGTLLGTVKPGPTDEPVRTEFLSDGHTLLIASSDGALYTWDTRPEHWIEFACDVAGRNFTADEWRDAFGHRPYGETCPTD
jgi:WD40 repeat protein/DNA-binding SARP family transcriptional activator/class 3 adenylate cyclase